MADVIISRILDFMKINNIRKSDLAKKIRISDPGLQKILNRKSMSCDMLLKISQALEHNFFEYLWPNEHKMKAIKLEKECRKLMKENEKLKIELEVVRGLLKGEST